MGGLGSAWSARTVVHRTAVCLAGLAALTLPLRQAQAEATHPEMAPDRDADLPLELHAKGCPEREVTELHHHLRIELAGLDSPAGAGAELPQLFVTCTSGQIELRVQFASGTTRTRHLDVSETSRAVRTRVVALAAAELLRDKQNDFAPPPPQVESPPNPKPPPSVSEEAPALISLVFAEAFSPGPFDAVQFGGGLALYYIALRPLVFGFSTQMTTERRKRTLGTANVTIGSASLSLAGLWELDAFSTQLGLGYRFGFARISGTPEHANDISGSSITGPWGGPFALGNASLRVSSAVYLQLGLELGRVHLPVTGRVEQDDDIELDGWWQSTRLGIGVGF